MKWEYLIVYLKGRSYDDPRIFPKSEFDKVGIDGWELVSVDSGIAYFKRPLRTKSEAEILAHFDYPQQDRSSLV